MMTATSARRMPSLLPALLIALITMASLVSCEDILNSILDTGAPTSLKASDGKYADRIEVSWTAPSLSGDKWTGRSVDEYIVRWWGPDNNPDGTPTHQTNFQIPVSVANRAKEYEIEVTTVVDGWEEGSSSDTGFALETFDLIWKDGGADYEFTGADRWYVTMLQKGFRYDFEFEEGGIDRIQFYEFGTLDMVHEIVATGVNELPSWVCDENGARHKFYVKVMTSMPAASFRASFGF